MAHSYIDPLQRVVTTRAFGVSPGRQIGEGFFRSVDRKTEMGGMSVLHYPRGHRIFCGNQVRQLADILELTGFGRGTFQRRTLFPPT